MLCQMIFSRSERTRVFRVESCMRVHDEREEKKNIGERSENAFYKFMGGLRKSRRLKKNVYTFHFSVTLIEKEKL